MTLENIKKLREKITEYETQQCLCSTCFEVGEFVSLTKNVLDTQGHESVTSGKKDLNETSIMTPERDMCECGNERERITDLLNEIVKQFPIPKGPRAKGLSLKQYQFIIRCRQKLFAQQKITRGRMKKKYTGLGKSGYGRILRRKKGESIKGLYKRQEREFNL